jgi:RND family efflux transporter MFP subunit
MLTRRKSWILCCLILFVLLVYFVWRKHHAASIVSNDQNAVSNVQLQSVTLHRIPLVVHAVGLVTEPQSVLIEAPQSGNIQTINFHAGQHVKKGDVLLLQEHKLQQAAFDQAEADYLAKQKNYQRVITVQKESPGVEAAADITTQAAALKVAKAIMLSKQIDLQQTTIRAPFSGVVEPIIDLSAVDAATGWVSGAYVPAASPIVKLINNKTVRVDYAVAARLRSRLRKGQPVRLIDIETSKIITSGAVSYVSHAVDNSDQTVTVSAVFPQNQQLVAGLNVQVQQILDAKRKAIAVPNLSLTQDLGGYAVYQIENGKVKMVPVVLGRRLGSLVEIKHGLKLGDKIVVMGMQSIHAGSSVKVVTA